VSPTAKKTIAIVVAVAFLGPLGWHAGGQWGLALTLVVLLLFANLRGYLTRGR
jgi:hypothetical protein